MNAKAYILENANKMKHFHEIFLEYLRKDPIHEDNFQNIINYFKDKKKIMKIRIPL